MLFLMIGNTKFFAACLDYNATTMILGKSIQLFFTLCKLLASTVSVLACHGHSLLLAKQQCIHTFSLLTRNSLHDFIRNFVLVSGDMVPVGPKSTGPLGSLHQAASSGADEMNHTSTCELLARRARE